MALSVSSAPYTVLGLTLADVKAEANINGTQHDDELRRYIAAAEAHVARRTGFGPRTSTVTASSGGLFLPAWPVLSVTSAVSGTTTYTSGLSVSDGGVLTVDGVTLHGTWTVTYLAGPADLSDLYLAALQDVVGLYQAGQVGVGSALGAFAEAEEPAPFRPVRSWQRIDAWVATNLPSGIA